MHLLAKLSEAYYNGKPLVSDEVFDALSLEYSVLGDPYGGKVMHHIKLYSLKKVLDDESSNLTGDIIITPKLDGAAIALLYKQGCLVQAATRGDGEKGKDILEKMLYLVPNKIPYEQELLQISGEIVAPKTIEHSRNYAAGSLGLKDIEAFKEKELSFVAYESNLATTQKYNSMLKKLSTFGFTTVLDADLEHTFPTDGLVERVNDSVLYNTLGFTAKYPRGAVARKNSSEMDAATTILRDVVWKTGTTGKVTPVAHFDEITLDDSRVTKATLHNVGFIRELDLDIGDEIMVIKSGMIIPKIISNMTKEIFKAS